MPNLNEIAEFRKELKDIAQEEQITSNWRERVYDELPPPDPAEVPELDIDALLSSPELAMSAAEAGARDADSHLVPPDATEHVADDTNSSGYSADNFDTVPVSDTPDELPDAFSNFDDLFSDLHGTDTTADTGDSSNFDDLFGDLHGTDTTADTGDSSNFDDLFGSQHGTDTTADTGDSSNFDDLFGDLHGTDTTADTGDSSNFDDLFGSQHGTDTTADTGDSSNFDDLFGNQHGTDTTADTGDSSNFDDFLSSLNFDDVPAADSSSNNRDKDDPHFPSEEDSASFGLDDSTLPELSSFDLDTLGSDFLNDPMSDNTTPDFDVDDSSFFDKGQRDIDTAAATNQDDAFLQDFDLDPLPEMDIRNDFDSADGVSDDDMSAPNVSDFDFSGFDTPLDSASESDSFDDFNAAAPVDSVASDIDTPHFPDMEELSLFSEDRGEYGDSFDAQPEHADDIPETSADSNTTDDLTGDSDLQDETIDDTNAPLSDENTGFEGVSGFKMPGDMSDSFFTQQNDDQSGFSLEDNVLDTAIPEVTEDQFNLPDNFKDFSADSHARIFDSVIAKSTGTALDTSSLTLTDDEYFDFLNRLESFPLNVQLVIQDYVGNGDDTAENKMDFIRLILSKASLKKIVHRLEKILNRSIPIPRGFQRKSVEEYEQEKKTFKYWFLHRFLPVAVMSGIALILIFCISVLSWQFIYKPVTAESLYKTGYAYLENGQYETAVEKFNKAGEYKRKKKWYLNYARAFRRKKQFTSAEKIYTRLIYDFDYDKQGSLEYADMLSTDLRNYEKAEFVLRRRLLDQHINDKDGLLALGDVYLNWADEDPEKYENAVKIYSRLIELYGENDTFLVRMLRYFIRTDNLAEVLVLKERFLSRLSKISAADITELSGYLLEKRYNPKPLDSEKLRMQIDDVRMLLEKAVQADRSIPEAYYNLGRFFIYNNKQDAAVENLTEAIKRFETAAPMTARRTINYVNAMRLLGEQLVAQKKYLDAQQLYANALNIYREYTAFKPLPPNTIIGKLYADYGDIDYFISYNFDSALDSYQNAVKELYNTPSVNYRIGYIHYQQQNYQQAIETLSIAYAEKPDDKHVLYGFGNALFKRGDYFAAQASYEQLLALLNAQRLRKGRLSPATRPDDAAFIEQYMHTANNLGATLNRLSERTGDSQKNARALALFAEATRAWDSLTRNPDTMIRSKSVGLAYLNIQNMVNPRSTYNSEIYTDIPMILEDEKPLEQKEDK